MSSKDGGFKGSGRFPISSGGIALGNIAVGLAAGVMAREGGSEVKRKMELDCNS